MAGSEGEARSLGGPGRDGLVRPVPRLVLIDGHVDGHIDGPVDGTPTPAAGAVSRPSGTAPPAPGTAPPAAGAVSPLSGTVSPSSGTVSPGSGTVSSGSAPAASGSGAGDRRRAEAEFEVFFQQHHRELGRLAYTMTGSQADADDIVGEGLASVWEHWERVQAADHPRAYVRRIIVNLAANRVKQVVRQRQTVGLLGPIMRWFHPGPDVPAAVDLQAAVLTLPPRRRACVLLRHVLDLSEDEVARTLGITVGTVKSQTSKGLAQLRVALADGPVGGENLEPRRERGDDDGR
jgi:RNA polymerase sigma-70 factor (sigma-E family)